MRASRPALLLAGLLAVPAAGADLPPWARSAAEGALPAFDKKVPAVVLVDEGRITLDQSGRLRRLVRYVVKVLTEKGRGAAVARVEHGTDARKIVSFDAWLLLPCGKVWKYGGRELLDVALAKEDVYNEARARVLSVERGAGPGAVFAWECLTEERPLFGQDQWAFQERLPVRLSRYTAILPPGWRAEGVVINHAGIQPTADGGGLTWELLDLPFRADEPLSPPATRLSPRLAVSFIPPSGIGPLGVFASWADVSRWYGDLVAAASTPNDAIIAKARELTREARTDLDRVRAIARHVQGVSYIAVQIGIGRYRPHSAADVLAKAYGDCKDKANLMRALLKAVGIEAHLVLAYVGDPAFVHEEWPSPSQFNHCIIAVRLPDGETTASVLEHPSLGRLLFFDPTHTDTMLGDLPEDEQGSWALVAAGGEDTLVRLPTLPVQSKGLERRVEATLAADGTLVANVREVSRGQAAAAERAVFSGPRPELARRLDRWVAEGVASARITTFRAADDETTGVFTLDLELSAPRYAQLMQQRMLMFQPVLLGRRRRASLPEQARTQPIAIEDESFQESLHLSLPAGFRVDELPPPVSLDAGFGTYVYRANVEGSTLTFTRSLETRRATLPAEEYGRVRGFFEKVHAAERLPVILVRGR